MPSTRDSQNTLVLQFDEMDVDTKLAQDYLKKNNNQFRSIGVTTTEKCINDAANNIIYCSIYENEKKEAFEQIRDSSYYINLNRLADNIEDNVDLFCQLEFLIRKKPIQTTALELKIIMKYLRYQASLPTYAVHNWKPVVLSNDSPLIDLGCIVLLGPTCEILATENTAVVCYLFTKLCHNSGLDRVYLAFLSNEDVKLDEFNMFTKNKVLEGGCIGVVTAQSDVESAVTTFLSAPKGELWGIRRILVQESATERLKTEFSWKSQTISPANVDPQLLSFCTNVYVYEDKIFVHEYVGNDTDLRNVVLIESFRTVKELLSLIDMYSPFCVSLWSQDAAESNEIAFGMTAPMVWVNCCYNLDGPNQVSLVYFSQIIRNSNTRNSKLDIVRKSQKEWMKLTQVDRQKKALKAIGVIPDDAQFKYYVQCLLAAKYQTNNFVHVGNNELIIGVQKPLDVYAINWQKMSETGADVIHRLLNGSGFLIYVSSEVDDSFKMFASRLAEAGLPIHLDHSLIQFDTFPLADTTRIIYTRFGTIFAN